MKPFATEADPARIGERLQAGDVYVHTHAGELEFCTLVGACGSYTPFGNKAPSMVRSVFKVNMKTLTAKRIVKLKDAMRHTQESEDAARCWWSRNPQTF